MSQIHQVFAQISQNEVAEGFYKIKGDVLTMVWFPDGEPVKVDDVSTFTAKIRPGDDPNLIARRLTKKIRKAFRGDRIDGFDRPIDYNNPVPTGETGIGFNRALNYSRERF